MPKRTKKTVLNSQARELVVRLREYFERERENGGPLISVNQVVDRVAQALDIGRNTVSRISKEKYGDTNMEDNKLSTPEKKRQRKCLVTKVNSFDSDAIRNHIYDYYRRKETPTVLKLLKSLKDAELFNGSATSLWRLLMKIGFRYKIINKRKRLMERMDPKMEDNKLSTPQKKMQSKCSDSKVDSFDSDAIRNHIYDYYQRKEAPTVLKLLKSLKDAKLFNGSATSLWKLLMKNGFRYKIINKRKRLMERTDPTIKRS